MGTFQHSTVDQESPNDDPAMPPTIWEITELTSSGQAAKRRHGASALRGQLQLQLLEGTIANLVARRRRG